MIFGLSWISYVKLEAKSSFGSPMQIQRPKALGDSLAFPSHQQGAGLEEVEQLGLKPYPYGVLVQQGED